MEQMRERVARAIWVAKGFDENTLHQHHEWEDWPVDERTEHVDFDGKTVVTLLHYAWRKCLPEADAALSLMQPEIDRRVAEEKAKLFERLRTPIWDALAAAYTTGATDVHNSWIAGTNGGEPDFGEAASDYAACVDPLTAFQQENSDGR